MAGLQQQDSHAGKEVASPSGSARGEQGVAHPAAHVGRWQAPPIRRHRSTAVGVCRYHVQLEDFQFRLRYSVRALLLISISYRSRVLY
jgi:hypothetical protein